MIHATRCATLLAIVLSMPIAIANPLIPAIISELYFTPGGWVLEMNYPLTNLDGWSLSSRSGTAMFKTGISLDHEYTLLTADSLVSPLSINPSGDSITIRWPNAFAMKLVFGPGPGSDVQAPSPGWSINFNQSAGYFYLDTIPTLGAVNDLAGAIAVVSGTVKDSSTLKPLSNATVRSVDEQSEVTGDSGRFSINVHARNCLLNVFRAGYNSKSYWVSLVPGQSLDTVFVLSTITAVSEKNIPQAFLFLRNYPNPFNPSTTLEYSLPFPGHVTITLYDLSGREVAELVRGYRPQGRYRVSWNGTMENASPAPSGIYLASLKVTDAANGTSTKQVIKLLLLR
ncbi:MAG: T9SS type A sorting domain-containing protein [Bacteroidota bacterium]